MVWLQAPLQRAGIWMKNPSMGSAQRIVADFLEDHKVFGLPVQQLFHEAMEAEQDQPLRPRGHRENDPPPTADRTIHSMRFLKRKVIPEMETRGSIERILIRRTSSSAGAVIVSKTFGETKVPLADTPSSIPIGMSWRWRACDSELAKKEATRQPLLSTQSSSRKEENRPRPWLLSEPLTAPEQYQESQSKQSIPTTNTPRKQPSRLPQYISPPFPDISDPHRQERRQDGFPSTPLSPQARFSGRVRMRDPNPPPRLESFPKPRSREDRGGSKLSRDFGLKKKQSGDTDSDWLWG